MDNEQLRELIADGIALMQKGHLPSAITLFEKVSRQRTDPEASTSAEALHGICLLLSISPNAKDEERQDVLREALLSFEKTLKNIDNILEELSDRIRQSP